MFLRGHSSAQLNLSNVSLRLLFSLRPHQLLVWLKEESGGELMISEATYDSNERSESFSLNLPADIRGNGLAHSYGF
jgi:hypothetical protein